MDETSGPPERRRGRDKKLRDDVAAMYWKLGLLAGAANPEDAQVILFGPSRQEAKAVGETLVPLGPEHRADELMAIADHHPEFKRLLARIVAADIYSAAILSHLAIATAIAANHGVKIPSLTDLVGGLLRPRRRPVPVEEMDPMNGARQPVSI